MERSVTQCFLYIFLYSVRGEPKLEHEREVNKTVCVVWVIKCSVGLGSRVKEWQGERKIML